MDNLFCDTLSLLASRTSSRREEGGATAGSPAPLLGSLQGDRHASESHAPTVSTFQAWAGSCTPSDLAGEKAFVDYAGPKFPVVDRSTGEVRDAMVFVGVLGASNHTFVDVTWSRALPDWTMSHVRMFEFWGGVPELVIPDNEWRSSTSTAGSLLTCGSTGKADTRPNRRTCRPPTVPMRGGPRRG